MAGRILTQVRMQAAMRRTAKAMEAAGKAALQNAPQGGSGKFLFVAPPNCCERCKLLGQTPHFFNTPDVAFITHPNCLCATIEAPAGLSPAELMEWAQNPVGTMRFGFNYGIPVKTTTITEKNRLTKTLEWQNRVRPDAIGSTRNMRRIRAKVSDERKEEVRRMVESGELGPAKDLTKRIQGAIKRQRTLAERKANRIPVRTAAPQRRTSPIPTLKNNGTTSWIPKPMPIRAKGGTAKAKESYTAVQRRNNRKLTENLPKNYRSTPRGGSMSARSKMDDERKRRKMRKKELRERGFV